MKRCWFQDEDGTYYRNCPLIMAERDHASARPWLLYRLPALHAEWQQVFSEGVIRKDKLGRGDELVQAAPFREAYPDRPGLWVLDDFAGGGR